MDRLQKILSRAGIASRRTAEELILQGRVEVNGEVVRTLGTKADPNSDTIKVDGRRIRLDVRPRYILLYKPKNVVSTRRDPQGRRTVLDLLQGVREYVYPVGRLDYDSEGLLLLTSDGDLAARLTHPRHGIERVYEVVVAGEPDEKALDSLRRGIVLDGVRTAPARVTRRGVFGRGAHRTTTLIIGLREGRNRQVRRMCARVGHPVRRLTRVRMGPLTLAGLRPAQWRDLTQEEVESLMRAVPRPETAALRPPRRAGASPRSRAAR